MIFNTTQHEAPSLSTVVVFRARKCSEAVQPANGEQALSLETSDRSAGDERLLLLNRSLYQGKGCAEAVASLLSHSRSQKNEKGPSSYLRLCGATRCLRSLACEILAFPGPNDSEANVAKIMSRVAFTRHTIGIAMHSVTRCDLVQTLTDAKVREVTVRVLTDSSRWKNLIPVKTSLSLHDKFFLVDSVTLLEDR